MKSLSYVILKPFRERQVYSVAAISHKVTPSQFILSDKLVFYRRIRYQVYESTVSYMTSLSSTGPNLESKSRSSPLVLESNSAS